MLQDEGMATVDPAHRIEFALIPALVGGLITLGVCAAAGVSPEPWMWLAAVAAGTWGYRYAQRGSTTPDTDSAASTKTAPAPRARD